jgi:hypothetical protein
MSNDNVNEIASIYVDAMICGYTAMLKATSMKDKDVENIVRAISPLMKECYKAGYKRGNTDRLLSEMCK